MNDVVNCLVLRKYNTVQKRIVCKINFSEELELEENPSCGDFQITLLRVFVAIILTVI